MVSKNRFYPNAYRTFWVAILVWIIVAGVIGLKAPRKTPQAHDSSAYSSSNGLLFQILGIPDGSQKILDAFPTIDGRGAVVVFWPRIDGNAIISSYLISYLSWPQQIWSVPIDDQHLAKAVDDFQKASFKTAVFYALKPPVYLPGVKRIGPMFIEPLAGPNPSK